MERLGDNRDLASPRLALERLVLLEAGCTPRVVRAAPITRLVVVEGVGTRMHAVREALAPRSAWRSPGEGSQAAGGYPRPGPEPDRASDAILVRRLWPR